ncbi:hypothetical protein R1flu_015305 [Riccia fluitans]|uniref:Uncharacterized protein n=1 Tax=Riccia fluitans TaxID=41844 RepID=A0ABD1YIK4_9MARC
MDRDRSCKQTKADEAIAVGTNIAMHKCPNGQTDQRAKFLSNKQPHTSKNGKPHWQAVGIKGWGTTKGLDGQARPTN